VVFLGTFLVEVVVLVEVAFLGTSLVVVVVQGQTFLVVVVVHLVGVAVPYQEVVGGQGGLVLGLRVVEVVLHLKVVLVVLVVVVLAVLVLVVLVRIACLVLVLLVSRTMMMKALIMRRMKVFQELV